MEFLEERTVLSVVGPEVQEFATGWLPPTEEQLQWERENLMVVESVQLNELGLERVTAEQLDKGLLKLAEADLDVVPFGEGLLGRTQAQIDEAPDAELALAGAPIFGLPSAVDNSKLQYFPPIGDQGGLGSCTTWATTYYAMTYMNAIVSGSNPASDDKTVIFSPKWTYNMINGGEAVGTSFPSAYNVMLDHGAATWAEFPYVGSKVPATYYREWVYDDPSVWRNAAGNRMDYYGTIGSLDTSVGLENLKTMLTNGFIVNYGTGIWSWQWTTIGDDPAVPGVDSEFGKQACYWMQGHLGPHAMTVVGYNDDLWIDINDNSIVDAGEKGALRIANSWGTGFKDNGFTWLAYDALKAVSAVPGAPSDGRLSAFTSAYWLMPKIDYTPEVLAEFTVNHAQRDQMKMSLGVGDGGDTPASTWTSRGLTNDGGPYGFDGWDYTLDPSSAPDGIFVLDYTDLNPQTESAMTYFLGLNDTVDDTVGGVVSDFKLTDADGNVLATCPYGTNPGNLPQDDDDGYKSVAYASISWSPSSAVSGGKWDDVDADGYWDSGELGLEGWTIYLDYNNNGQLDVAEDEPFTLTDSEGAFTFVGVEPGVCTVAQEEDPNWVNTFPATDPEGTERVSLDALGLEGDGASGRSSIGADGRYVAFESDASNLVPGDANDAKDIFVYDRRGDTIQRVSVDSAGSEAHGTSSDPAISADGRYVAFVSEAADLVSSDFNNSKDIFVHDRQTGETERISVGYDGSEANSWSYEPSISSDGRYVAFASYASNLVWGDTNNSTDVFVYDRDADSATRVSVGTYGVEANGWSYSPAISANGSTVAFVSDATNLVFWDLNAASDVFVHNLQTGVTERVSVASSGTEGNKASSAPALSADAQYVAFVSYASNLVADDYNRAKDVFVYDRYSNTTERVSVASDGTEARGWSYGPSFSADGRYIGFLSTASNLVPDDDNGKGDIFVHDRPSGTTNRISVASDGSQADGWSYHPSLSACGRYVAFGSDASNLVPDDTNGARDVFVAANDNVGLPGTHLVFLTPGKGVQGVEFGSFSLQALQPYIEATSGDDTITFTTGDTHVVTINETLVYQYDPALVSVIYIDGLDGDDQITITGGPDDETATLTCGVAFVSGFAGVGGPSYDLYALAVEDIRVEGGGGDNDQAQLFGASGNVDDTFKGYETRSELFGTGYFSRASDFDYIEADVTGGTGNDRAFLYDTESTPGDDVFYGYETESRMELSTGLINEVKGFDEVKAYGSSSAGGDNAYLFGSAGVDQHVVSGGYGYLEGKTIGHEYYNYAEGFDLVRADVLDAAGGNGGGDDRAYMFDTGSIGDNDTFRGDGQDQLARLELDDGAGGIVTAHEAKGFDRVKAFSSAGTDAAYLEGSDQNDLFNVNAIANYAYLRGRKISDDSQFYYFQVRSYASVSGDVTVASSPSDDDRAVLLGTNGDDAFYGYHDRAWMDFSAGMTNLAAGFDRVTAYARDHVAGDVAHLFGSDADDTFIALKDTAYLKDTAGGTYYNYVRGFDEVYADMGSASGGGGLGWDLAVLHDWSGSQLFHGRDNYGYASDDDHKNQATDFDKIVARGSIDNGNTLDVDGSITYSFVNSGWVL